MLAKAQPRHLGLNAAQRTAVFLGGKGFGIEGFLMGDATGQKDVNDRLGLPFLGGKEFLIGLQPEKVTQGQSQSPNHPHLQKTAA